MRPSAPRGDAARVAVWETLSDLFLDADPALFTDVIARDLAASPYSLSELEAILLREVYPALWPNLAIVAGEWRGFDRTWLRERIEQGASRLSLLRAATIGRWWLARSPEWRAIKTKIAARRERT